MANNTPPSESTRSRHRSDRSMSINQRFDAIRQRIVSQELQSVVHSGDTVTEECNDINTSFLDSTQIFSPEHTSTQRTENDDLLPSPSTPTLGNDFRSLGINEGSSHNERHTSSILTSTPRTRALPIFNCNNNMDHSEEQSSVIDCEVSNFIR